jgi:hypothetical protein
MLGQSMAGREAEQPIASDWSTGIAPDSSVVNVIAVRIVLGFRGV